MADGAVQHEDTGAVREPQAVGTIALITPMRSTPGRMNGSYRAVRLIEHGAGHPAIERTDQRKSDAVASVFETDATLVALAQGGDVAAFDRIVTRYERTVFSVALRILRERTMAEDATQDALFKAWTAIGSFSGETILPWLVRIVTNRCYDVVRVRNRRWIDSLDQEDCYETTSWRTQSTRCEEPADFLDRSELSSRLRAALDALNPDQRAVVVLADIHGYAYEEIAAMLGLAVGTVKSRLSRGRGHLRTTLIGTVGYEVARFEAELTLR